MNQIISFLNSFRQFILSIWGIIKAIYYGLTSLLTGVWSLIIQIFNGELFGYVGQIFSKLIDYIGLPAVIFISSLFLLIIFRIGVSFVFKILRLNVDYHSLSAQTKRWSVEDMKNKH